MRVRLRWTQLCCAVMAARIEWCRIEFELGERELPPRSLRLVSSLEPRYDLQSTWRPPVRPSPGRPSGGWRWVDWLDNLGRVRPR